MLDFLMEALTGIMIAAIFEFSLFCLYVAGYQEVVRVILTVTSILGFLSFLIAMVFYLMGRRR